MRGGPGTVPREEIARLAAHFADPPYREFARDSVAYRAAIADSRPFARWAERNVRAHKRRGYAIVTLSLKRTGTPPGDMSASEMDAIAALADRFSFGEVRVTHEQNLLFADVLQSDVHALWTKLKSLGLATPNIGLLTDIICCPGGDFCSLANAKSIPIAEAIQRRFDDLDYVHDLGDLELNISGCMNACGHHHVGNIGILGVDKNGEEWYQVSIGGAQGNDASLGKVIGPSFAAAEMPDVIARLIDVYVERRHRRRALHRHRAATRPRAVQRARLCRRSLRIARVVADRWTLLREATTLDDVPPGVAGDRPALALAERAGRPPRPRRRWRLAGADRRSCCPRRRYRRAAAHRRRLPEIHRRPWLLDCTPASRPATDFAANCARSATCCAISSSLLSQCGFDAFALRADRDATEALASFDDFDSVYTSTTKTREPWFRRRAAPPWNKRPPRTFAHRLSRSGGYNLRNGHCECGRGASNAASSVPAFTR